MRKHFLLFLLMVLLPLAGWAQTIDNEYDVTVVPSDGSAVWCGGKPTVQAGWLIVQSEAATKPTKAQVAEQIEVVDLADYNVGNHTYVLKLKTGALGYVDIATGVEDHFNRYYLHTNAQNTATLTITKCMGLPGIDVSALKYVDGPLTYNGSAQALLQGGATATTNSVSVPVIYTLTPNPNAAQTVDTLYSYADVKATNAGTYTLYYKVAGTDNYNGSNEWEQIPVEVNPDGASDYGSSIEIAKATQNFAAEGAAPTANTWTYDAAAHALVIAPTSPVANGTYEYCATNSDNDEDWTTDPTTITGTSNTGNKTVYWRVKDTENYKGHAAASLTATITKATPTFTTEPTFAEDFSYDGQAHQLITNPGVAEFNATPSFALRYKRVGSNTWSDWSTWSENYELRTATNAAEYQIAYCTKTTDDLNKPESIYKTITVSQIDIPAESFTAPVAKTGLRYNEADQELVTAASWVGDANYGAILYSSNGTDWSADVPTGNAAGDYTVYFKIDPVKYYSTYSNYNVVASNYTVTIGEQNPAYIVPVAKSKTYGQSTDPELTYTVVDGDGNALENTVLKGTVTLAREAGNTVGKYIIYVQNYVPGENEDYDVLNVLNDPADATEANKTAFFSIIADPNNTLKLKFTDAAVATKVYDGTTAVAFNNDDLEIESGALGTDTWETLKGSANITFALKTTEGAAPANANVGNYQVVATYSDGLVNYANVEIAPLAYTITKKQLAVVVEDQTVNYGVAIASAETANWNLAAGSAYVDGENNDNAGIVLYTAQAINTYEPGSENDDAIMAKIEGDSNYEIAADGNTWGKLTINDAAALVLKSDADDFAKINAFDGQNVNVTIDFTARNARTLGGQTRPWKAEEWVVLTLPFEISVSDLSKALGYAIVNVIDPDRTEINGTSSKFYGKLTMKGGNGNDTRLAANKPFLVKTVDDIANVDFGSQLIVAPENEEALSVDAGLGAKFTGTYTTKEVSKTDEAKIWFMLSGFQNWAYVGTNASATWNIVPLEGFIDMKNASSANEIRSMTFFFEEEDGTVTAIESVNAEGANSAASAAAEGWYTINGVKLEAKPTQKGIYIFNGKKVAIQ